MSSVTYSERCQRAVQQILSRLHSELSPDLTYHAPGHSEDVIEAAERIGLAMALDVQQLELLRTAAAYHDCGFLVSNQNHEEAGCDIARESLRPLGYSASEIESICGMIMATKIPQAPKTLLEEVLCDADLDYLGREDFDEISNSLFKEFLHFGIVQDNESWMKLQVSFFKSHHYWTAYSKENREPRKKSRLQELTEAIN